jgi:glycosyltransferase involved in cell wall biosynthesis
MIACLAKVKRVKPLFEALEALDARYRYIGGPIESKAALLRGAVCSPGSDLVKVRREARFSPVYLNDFARQCWSLLDKASEPVEAVIYWGAVNPPVDLDRPHPPYFVITDGPFDPNDSTYPVEWKPERWAKTYFETQRRIFSEAAHVFTLSDWARNKVLNVHGLAAGKVTKCGWGPLNNIGGPRLEPNTGRTLFLSIGSEWKRKGMDVIAEAGSRLRKEHPCETIIVGSPVDLHLKPEPGVTLFPNPVPANICHSLMRDACALVIGSRFDASPHVIYDSLQYGTPVIATRTCGVPEAVKDGYNGFLIDECDPEQLLDAMRRFIAADQSDLRRSAYESSVAAGGWAAVAAHIHGAVSDYLDAM